MKLLLKSRFLLAQMQVFLLCFILKKSNELSFGPESLLALKKELPNSNSALFFEKERHFTCKPGGSGVGRLQDFIQIDSCHEFLLGLFINLNSLVIGYVLKIVTEWVVSTLLRSKEKISDLVGGIWPFIQVRFLEPLVEVFYIVLNQSHRFILALFALSVILHFHLFDFTQVNSVQYGVDGLGSKDQNVAKFNDVDRVLHFLHIISKYAFIYRKIKRTVHSLTP